MSSVIKSSPNVIKRTKKDNESREAEYKFTKALFQLGANKLLEAVKSDKVLLNSRDLKDLHSIKQASAIDDLEDAGMYFVSCNSCLFHRSCTLFTVGCDCKFNLAGADIKSSKDIVNVMVKLLQIESDRIQRSLLMEKMDGGIDKEVSAEIMQFFDMVDRLKNIMTKEESVEIRVKGQGAISKIFGDIINRPSEKKPVDVSEESIISVVKDIVVQEEAVSDGDSKTES